MSPASSLARQSEHPRLFKRCPELHFGFGKSIASACVVKPILAAKPAEHGKHKDNCLSAHIGPHRLRNFWQLSCRANANLNKCLQIDPFKPLNAGLYCSVTQARYIHRAPGNYLQSQNQARRSALKNAAVQRASFEPTHNRASDQVKP